MEITNRHKGTLRYIQSHWPVYLLGFGGGSLIVLFIIWFSAVRAWYSFVLLGLVTLLILAYFFVSSLWAANLIYGSHTIADTIITLGKVTSQDIVVHISLGRRQLAVDLCQHLTTGRVIVIDIYNPQMAPGRPLARWRRQAEHIDPDPRLSWRDGIINLLPLPDESVPVVTMSQVLSELWQSGDRQQLLAEIHRILTPGGSLLLAERVRTSVNILLMGPSGLRLPSATYWNKLLKEAGLEIDGEDSLNNILCTMRATKPIVEPSAEEKIAR